MSVAGQDVTFPLFLYLSGSTVGYATKTAFQAASWNITFHDVNDNLLSPQPSWTMPVAGDSATGRHVIKFPEPDGIYTVKIIRPAAGYSSPMALVGEGTTYDIDNIGATIASFGGSAISPTLRSNTASMFDGDSIDLTFFVYDAALASIGATSLADCSARACEIKLDNKDSSVSPDVATLVETILTDTTGNRTLRATLDTFPSAIAVAAGQKSTSATAHLRLTKSTKTIIASEIKLTINWKATA